MFCCRTVQTIKGLEGMYESCLPIFRIFHCTVFNKQLPSNDEIASRISYAIARQYEDAKDFEMVKSNVFSALMITLGLKDMERQWEEEKEMFARNDN